MATRPYTANYAGGPDSSGGVNRPKLLVDECLSPRLVLHAREQGFHANHLRDLGLLGLRDQQLAKAIFGSDWCFVTRNARHFRGPAVARGSRGVYAGRSLHAGLICLHSAAVFDSDRQLEAFSVALDEVAHRRYDTTNLLIEVTWGDEHNGGLLIEVFDFPDCS